MVENRVPIRRDLELGLALTPHDERRERGLRRSRSGVESLGDLRLQCSLDATVSRPVQVLVERGCHGVDG